MTSAAAVTLRPCVEADLPFLQEVYANTRLEELAPLGWSEAQTQAFLQEQFRVQHAYYHRTWPAANYSVVLLDGQPVGRLYVDRRDDELRVLDLALLPSHRGQGIGGGLLAEILAEARGRGLPVRIHVEQGNPARRLYERLGFREIHAAGFYHFMEWRA
jgi:GNAT superfamily N-acetyltransferase